MSSSRASIAVLGLSGLVAACALTSPPAPDIAVEGLPGPAYLRLAGDPPTAARPFAVSFAGEDGDRGGQTFEFVKGQTVVIERLSLPQTVSAWVDETACEGTLRTLTDREIDGILAVGDDTCSLTATREHPVGDAFPDLHPDLLGTLSAQAPLGTTLTLTSLDGAIPGEVSDDTDESGWISIPEGMSPGRWRAVLTSGNKTLLESTVTVEAGESIHLDLRTPEG